MTTTPDFSNLMGLVGGVSGLILLVYMILMIYYSRARQVELQHIRVDLARIEGILVGRSKK